MNGQWKLVAWELVVLLASVPVFRGAWTLMDGVGWLSSPEAQWASIGAGLLVAAIGLRAIQRGS